MFKIISKIPFNYIGRYCNFITTLPISLAFAVTYRCNFKCKTCNIWENHYREKELDLSQIENIFRSLRKSFYWLTITGGEPFLRKDLADICQIIYKNCKPRIITIPSNGYLTNEIVDCVKRILILCPGVNIMINLSLNHLEAKHDEINGYPGSFNRLLKTYQGLKDIGSSQLHLSINTIISNYNIKDWETIRLFGRKMFFDNHLFELAQLRDEYRNKHLNYIVPSKEESILLLEKLSVLTKNYKKNFIGRCLASFRKNYYALVKKILTFERQVLPCFAGVASCYILPDGKVWACGNNAQVMGDLNEYNFNFRKLWRSKTAENIRSQIKNKRCFCIQVNANYLNLLHSPLYFSRLIYDILF